MKIDISISQIIETLRKAFPKASVTIRNSNKFANQVYIECSYPYKGYGTYNFDTFEFETESSLWIDEFKQLYNINQNDANLATELEKEFTKVREEIGLVKVDPDLFEEEEWKSFYAKHEKDYENSNKDT